MRILYVLSKHHCCLFQQEGRNKKPKDVQIDSIDDELEVGL